MTDLEYRQRVSKWVQARHSASHGCPVCDGRGLHVGPPVLVSAALPALGPVPALIPVTCAGCGHVLLFDAEALGLAGQPDGHNSTAPPGEEGRLTKVWEAHPGPVTPRAAPIVSAPPLRHL